MGSSFHRADRATHARGSRTYVCIVSRRESRDAMRWRCSCRDRTSWTHIHLCTIAHSGDVLPRDGTILPPRGRNGCPKSQAVRAPTARTWTWTACAARFPGINRNCQYAPSIVFVVAQNSKCEKMITLIARGRFPSMRGCAQPSAVAVRPTLPARFEAS